MKRLAIHGGNTVIEPDEARFIWPLINNDVREAVLKQLDETISIYDNSGIFGSFEQKYADDHNHKFGILFNSGTSAIMAMYFAINLKPGDKVLCPAYTFHATVSPLMSTGAHPVFCDSDNQGNISINSIKEKYTPDVKAIVVTHMWGVPIKNIEKIAEFCKEKNLVLLEDCSHAHGAKFNGKPIGSFGHISAWSLQGQKIISGGEGGILATSNDEYRNRALLLGHYNKRPKKEISDSYDLKKYFLTGYGLKLRAHPVAIAIAAQQYESLEQIINQKQIFADKLIATLEQYSFFSVATQESSQFSWYALPIAYNQFEAANISREKIVEALHEEGLVEYDIPGSTGLINYLPLFNTPNELMPHLYPSRLENQGGFVNARQFQDTLIKLPVWATSGDSSVVDKYIEGTKKVCDYIAKNGDL